MLAREKALAALLAALPGLAAPGLAQAQGLGEIVLNSSLNEPLDATIPLFQLRGLDESQLRVDMASEGDFARSDIPRPDFLRYIEFSVEIAGDSGVLRLTTDTPVVEPYLNFLVDARWPSGRMLREYTVLLDLPTFSQAAAAPVQPAARAPEPAPAPSRAQPAPAAGRDPATDLNPSSPSEQAATPSAGVPSEIATAPAPAQGTSVGSTGTVPPPESLPGPEEVAVAANDTLWQIALETRPDNSVSVQQMMLAIQRANQGAFIAGNINGLRTGEVLRIPTIDEVLAVNREQAVEQVALQNSRFGQAAELDAQPLVGGGGDAGPATLAGGDELSVLTGGDVVQDGGAGQEDLAATVAELEAALMLSEENLDRANLENEELRSRLTDLEAQIETLQNIIAIEDQRLAQLQAELAAQADAQPAADASGLAAAPADDTDAVTEPAADPAPSVQPAAAAANPDLSALVDTLGRNPLVMGGGLGGLVLLVLGFLVWRRRKDEQGRDDEEVFEPRAESVAADAEARQEPGFGETRWDEQDENSAGGAAGDQDSDPSGFAADGSEPDWLQDSGFSVEEEGESVAAAYEQHLSEDDTSVSPGFAEADAGEGPGAASVEEGLGAAAFEEAPVTSPETLPADDEAPLRDADGAGDDLALDLDFDLDDLDFAATAQPDDAADEGASAAALDDGQDDGEDFDLDISLEDEAAASDASGEDTPEALEFSLDRADEPASEPASRADGGDLESFEFRLDNPVATASAAQPSGGEDDAENMLEFDLDDARAEPEAAQPAAAEEEEMFDIAFDLDAPEEGSGEDREASTAAGDEEPLDMDIEFEGFGEEGEAGSASRSRDEDDLLDFGNLDIDEELLMAEDEEEDETVSQPLTDRDESSTKLDLAVAYEAMGDLEGALEILDEVIAEGNEAQAGEARELKLQWSRTEAGE